MYFSVCINSYYSCHSVEDTISNTASRAHTRGSAVVAGLRCISMPSALFAYEPWPQMQPFPWNSREPGGNGNAGLMADAYDQNMNGHSQKLHTLCVLCCAPLPSRDLEPEPRNSDKGLCGNGLVQNGHSSQVCIYVSSTCCSNPLMCCSTIAAGVPWSVWLVVPGLPLRVVRAHCSYGW